MAVFLDVIVDIAHSDVDKIFEYSYFDNSVKAGCRVLVPFGKYTTEGFVMRVKQDSVFDKSKIKPILKVLDQTPVLTEETLALSQFVSKKYYVNMATALRLFLPSEMRKGKVKDKIQRYCSVKDGLNIEQVVCSLKKSQQKQKDLLYFLSENGQTLVSELNNTFGQSAVKGADNKGFLTFSEQRVMRSPYQKIEGQSKNVVLTSDQQNAVNSITETSKTVSLIYGVTGSGKTEIYLDLIDKAIKDNKTAIMLVPEISLTPQMFRQLRGRFGENAAILHSGLSAGERYDEWARLRSGEAKIAIGARSAIFSPLENIGIIVIDEEHDGSYQSESSPRYSTVDIALFRAKMNNCKIVLGSATPSVNSFLKAKQGEYNLVELTKRINQRPLPDIETVDMRKEVRRGNNTPFSGALKAELADCLSKGNQAIIFLNQRGYSKTVVCSECGHVQKCEACDVSLTYHKEDESLLCHYCGAKYKMISACTECGSPHLRYGGTGTEKVVIELKKLFPNAKILRMDRDTTATKEGHFEILKEFSDRKADILVGTQMIAKGHDFPFVTLVGILDADMSLYFSDYRSGERTFQLITQVAGRSGRAQESGKVVLQTYSPDNAVLNQAIRYDYQAFFNHEISVRKATWFPPFTDIVRVLVSADDDQKALETIKNLYGEVSAFYKENIDNFRFFGCMKAPLKKLQNKYRYQILMRVISDRQEIVDNIYAYVQKYNSKAVSVYLEVNPNNLT